jgi:hypothetical protein
MPKRRQRANQQTVPFVSLTSVTVDVEHPRTTSHGVTFNSTGVGHADAHVDAEIVRHAPCRNVLRRAGRVQRVIIVTTLQRRHGLRVLPRQLQSDPTREVDTLGDGINERLRSRDIATAVKGTCDGRGLRRWPPGCQTHFRAARQNPECLLQAFR